MSYHRKTSSEMLIHLSTDGEGFLITSACCRKALHNSHGCHALVTLFFPFPVVDCSSKFHRSLASSYEWCISASLASQRFRSSLPSPQTPFSNHASTSQLLLAISSHYHDPRPGAMDRDSAAARTEAFENALSLSQTASQVSATTWDDSEHVYITCVDPLNLHQKNDIDQISHSTSEPFSPPVLKTSSFNLFRSKQPLFWSSNAFEVVANEAMSRHTSQESKKVNKASGSTSQYQLMSSESPADQAKSLSQVSPGFIFVIFPLSCDALLLALPHSSPAYLISPDPSLNPSCNLAIRAWLRYISFVHSSQDEQWLTRYRITRIN